MNDTHWMYDEFGDQIMMQVTPDLWDPADLTLDEQRQAARDYAAKYCNPDKPSIFNGYGNQVMTDAFREELYKCSRINYCGAL